MSSTEFLQPQLFINKNSASVAGCFHSQSIFEIVRVGSVDQVIRVREGLPANCVAEVSEALAMSCVHLLETLRLSTRSVCARIKKNKTLTPAEGNVLLRLAKAQVKAEEVFEDRVQASVWLKRKIRTLGNVMPASLMDTSSGFELVMKELGRIEHGVVA